MRRNLGFLIVLLAFTSTACPPAPKDDLPKIADVKIDDAPRPKLESLEQLRPRIEAAIEQVQSRDLLVEHGFWTVFHGILGSGLDKAMLTDPTTKKKTKAIDYICAGGKMPGMQFVPTVHGLDVRTTGKDDDLQFLAQGHQDQFIAEMTEWGMARSHPFLVGGKAYSFEDFIRHSTMRASVTQKQELSWAIIVIGQFYGVNHHWINGLNEPMTYEDVVRYEVNSSINEAACGGTHRLFGITWAYHLHLKAGGKNEGVWKDAETKINEYKQLAKKLQNADGSFSTDYFKGTDHKPEPALRIGTTGHIVEWLALAMTDEELRAPWMQNAVSRLSVMILDMNERAIDGGSLYHAAHGLHLYHERVFGAPAAYLALPPRK